ncbi:unnamed protein product [Paramecium primaurelia]|uniref:Uncharacterized protein n=1 Tax=Paramecium primaurelia TaxID=5886 RepID=A0A8S1MKN0_PARPR|nr:unnamed protein product [Paramecium primaurelia]
MYINSENLLLKLQGQAFGIDIEFSKKKICLIQISDGNQIYLFDPIALNLEQYIRDFLKNDAIKIFQSVAQDLKCVSLKRTRLKLNCINGKSIVESNLKDIQKKDYKEVIGFQEHQLKNNYIILLFDCKYLVMLIKILLKQYTEDDKKSIHFSIDVTVPKLLKQLKKQLAQNEDVLLPQNIYRHIQFQEPFKTDDQKIIKLIEQLKIEKRKCLQFQEKLTTHKPIYSDNCIYSLIGQQLCFCDKKKIQLQIKNGLREYLDQKSIKLNFDSLSEIDEKEIQFYDEERAHDIVMLCAYCHLKDKIRIEIAQLYGVPLQYYGEEKKTFDLVQYEKIRNQFKDLIQLPIEFKLKKKSKNLHGEIVVKKLVIDEKIEEFIMIFRKHFLLSINPQFLLKEWAIDHQFKSNFGEFPVYYQKLEQKQDLQQQKQQIEQK